MIPQVPAWLKVGGVWVHAHAHVGDLEVTDRRGGGNYAVSWQMNLRAGRRPTWLHPNAPVEVYAGGLRWSGHLGDPDWDGGTFTADGAGRKAETTPAVNAAGEPTAHLGQAISSAYARGAIDFQAAESLGALPDPATEVNTIGALADQYALESGRTWAVHEDRMFRTATDPTEPTLFVLPGIVDLPASTSTQVTHVMVEYLRKSDLARARVEAGAGDRTHERRVSMERLGTITPARAQAVANEIFKRAGGGLPAFTSGFEVAPGQVVNAGGRAVDLSMIRPGRMIRLLGTEDPRTGSPTTDLVIDETQWRATEQRVQVNPVNLDAADFESIVEELGGSVIF